MYGLHYNQPGPGLKSATEFNSSYSVLLSSGHISGQHCFSFWHLMYGSHVETLNVFVTVDGEQLLYFSKSGNQGLRYFTPPPTDSVLYFDFYFQGGLRPSLTLMEK